ncbi:hypothetical protein E4U57_002628 [Claviceps arundinis]|uniref:Aminoglycoside phosphotransferase domain-containing protein n=1 Tax=Claviceps arundinis TaxID=1623583 RepID=A0ABQ7P8T1_9HYPO|nr:hypothetical protein E4U57_002628 [Claviceps arundinis]
MRGGLNCHAEIKFEDGVVWLARFRILSAIAPPPEVRDYVLQSEAMTMQFLDRHTRVPSPRVFDWACESDPMNTIGVGYILMEKLNGTSLNWQKATAAQKEKIVRQYVDIMLEIERHPFDQLGSLIATTGFMSRDATQVTAVESQIQVGALADFTTFRSGDAPPGSKEAFRVIVEENIRMVVTGEIGEAEQALDILLVHRFRLDVLNKMSEQTTTAEKGGEKFFLKHADEKGDHILVNADFDIIGIIDWEWCQTTSREEAFSSPCMMWPVGAFHDGSNELAEEELLLARVFREKGREDLASCVLRGRKIQRFLFALHDGVAQLDEKTFASLFVGLKRAFDGRDVKTDAQAVEDEWEVWRAKALEDWKHEALFKSAIEANDRLAATHHVEAPIAESHTGPDSRPSCVFRNPESAFLPKISRRHLEESICLPCGPVIGTTVAFQQLNKLEIACSATGIFAAFIYRSHGMSAPI